MIQHAPSPTELQNTDAMKVDNNSAFVTSRDVTEDQE